MSKEFWENKYNEKDFFGKEPTFYLKQNEELLKKNQNKNCLVVKISIKKKGSRWTRKKRSIPSKIRIKRNIH
jgi:hypothetical protein